MAMRALAEEHPDDERWRTVHAWVVDVDEDRATRIVLADNRTADLGSYDTDELLGLLETVDHDLDGTGYDYDDLEGLSADVDDEPETGDGEPTAGDGDSSTATAQEAALTLAERFLLPPMTIIDTRRGEWQNRKRAWLGMGIASQEGRAENLIKHSIHTRYQNWYEVWNEAVAANPGITNDEVEEWYAHKLHLYRDGNGTSVFDPVLAELLYLWFSNPGDDVLDPWAGGSVRGIVANHLDRHYQGHELRDEQCEANRAQWETIDEAGHSSGHARAPVWIPGDSRQTMKNHQGEAFDFAIGCPPYYDLEAYSDDEADLSNMTTEEFNTAMAATLREVDRCLRPDRFAAFIVGSVRDKRGDLRDMKTCMVNAAPDGWHLANDAVLVNNVGAAAIRAKATFEKGRALQRTHQDILVFVKGDRKTAARRLHTIEVADLTPTTEEPTE
ncbi:hypothetical protein [Corynebacterium sp.]|uniref:hypothetical protein n=1 Tax=Corynebacterium sp. TaxID=1720 RepID=UPI002A91661B|nr:hypothetical protein [Corynebacterium sp.]MDY5785585.1 hypothetical protein [Corynebacterium sp.]